MSNHLIMCAILGIFLGLFGGYLDDNYTTKPMGLIIAISLGTIILGATS